MKEQLIILPILFQLAMALLLLFFWRKHEWQRYISVIGSLLSVGLAAALFNQVWTQGILSVQSGNWSAPFGITLVADTLSASLVIITSIIGLAVSMYAAGSIMKTRSKYGFFAIFHFLLMGLNGAFLTGDIFNLYVWFEIMIISSFVLLTIGGEKPQLEGAVKYFTLNMLASIIFLTAIGVLYGLTGSLNMADLSGKIAAVENQNLVRVTAFIFLIGFGIKSAIFPLYFWLPASYHTPPPAVSSIFGGLLTKVGVYAMIRVFTLLFTRDPFFDQLLIVLAMLTIFSGGIGALVQHNIQKIFSYFIICHIGFMIAGLGMYNEVGLTGGVFYMFHDIIVKASLFMVGGISLRILGTTNYKKMGGFYANYPKLSLLFFIPLFSLVGIPPLSGFWPKISLFQAAWTGQQWFLIAFMIFGSFITLFVIARMWSEVFWKKATNFKPKAHFKLFSQYENKQKVLMISSLGLLVLVMLYIGFFAEHIQSVAHRISTELLDSTQYINSVLESKIKQ